MQEAKKAGRYSTENGNEGSKPHTPVPLEADGFEIIETGHTLLATLGYPIFEPVAKSAVSAKPDEFFYCKASGADGRGMYTEESFVVIEGHCWAKRKCRFAQRHGW